MQTATQSVSIQRVCKPLALIMVSSFRKWLSATAYNNVGFVSQRREIASLLFGQDGSASLEIFQGVGWFGSECDEMGSGVFIH